jgi:hypothetical protein
MIKCATATRGNTCPRPFGHLVASSKSFSFYLSHTVQYVLVLCCVLLLWMLVFSSLVVAFGSLCEPCLSIELYVGTLIHTVATASTFNTKVRFPNCIVQRVFSSRTSLFVHKCRESVDLKLEATAKQASKRFCKCSLFAIHTYITR